MMNKYLLVFLVAVNLVGMIIGVSAYYYSLQRVHPLLWVFLLDCPLAALFFVSSLFKRELRAFAFVYMMKYGIWTLIAYGLYWGEFMAFAPLSDTIILLAGHIGMIFQAGIFGFQKISRKYAVGMVSFFLANDLIDFFYLSGFTLPSGNHLIALLAYNLAATVSLPFLANRKSFGLTNQKD